MAAFPHTAQGAGAQRHSLGAHVSTSLHGCSASWQGTCLSLGHLTQHSSHHLWSRIQPLPTFRTSWTTSSPQTTGWKPLAGLDNCFIEDIEVHQAARIQLESGLREL